MDNSLFVSLSQAKALEHSLNIAANNMANVNTVGFKAERADFQSLVEDNLGPAGQNQVDFVGNKGSYLDTSQGRLQQTGNPLDLAISGPGWFAYRTAAGQTAFGRDGRFTIDGRGNLVTLTGAQVLSASGAPVAIPNAVGNQITISKDGTITGTNGQALGQVGVFDVPQIASYSRIGDGMMAPASGAPPRLILQNGAQVSQGFLEQSNVEPVIEMTRMMEIQRAYERASKMMDEQASLRQQTLTQLGRATG